MSFDAPFPPKPLLPSGRLPLTLISLEEWALVGVTGPDTLKYLQGQLTTDVAAMAGDGHILGGHCDAKGKMWSNLRIFHRGGGMAYIERRSIRDAQIGELKKYAVFSKVVIAADDDAVLLGVAGTQAREALGGLFAALPDTRHGVIQEGETTLLHFSLPTERFLLVTSRTAASALAEKLNGRAHLNDSRQWLALNIEAGLPVIDSVNSGQFIPQAVNLQALGGISFDKGCYAGQEMVARAKYRGANKRALYWLAGKAGQVPAAGGDLELRLGDNWRRTGTILAACRLDNGELWVQAVLNNDLPPDSLLRVKDDADGALAVRPLPYPVTD
ncbi:tRNA-modifying protein YgfZ [Martelella alba]|uniref:tRNA-modifying protein YgfZ n=1 Tax=Martelella alba TaxID=2590451 RepID=A0ABY2SFM5_9HYPH|nr:tRNA-modifying protein YgfZ [Martelella alba]TKI03790.1 tRNA-modifying protein YgfZ [Martelella alba]